MIRQAVILCGGLGTRLGPLTETTPKPMLPVGGRPFLEILIGEVARQGFDDIVLLAGFCAGQIRAFIEQSRFIARLRVKVRVVVEPAPAGTGGALLYADDVLAPEFLLMNGDSLFDIPLRQLCVEFDRRAGLAGVMALREIARPDRYGVVEVSEGIVQRFAEREEGRASSLINGGIYVLRRDAILPLIGGSCSLEGDIFPQVAGQGILGGFPYRGFFLDIGIPDSYAEAQRSVTAMVRRPAIFFDRDGVLNEDHGYVGSADRFDWVEGAKAAVRYANDAGYLVLVVTNQAGVARGFYSEADVAALFDHMQTDLAELGAHLDDYRYCPHHSEGTRAEYARTCDWRKPAPGMILDLADQWGVDLDRSLLIGDKQSDLDAAIAAGVAPHFFSGGALDAMIAGLLPVNSQKD